MLDFSSLTDEQLVELIREACAEACRRGAACEAAARQTILTEAERAQISASARNKAAEALRRAEIAQAEREAQESARRTIAEREAVKNAEDTRRMWTRRKGVAEALVHAGWDVAGDQIVVWGRAGDDKRVFLQKQGFGSGTYATLFVTGNRRNAPNSIEWTAAVPRPIRDKLAIVLRAIGARYSPGVKIDLSEALAYSGPSEPLELEAEERTAC